MSIRARYSGVCPDCDEKWQPGDLIRSDFKVPGRYPIWTHAVCPDPTTDHLIGKPCDTCWLIHSEGACDRE